MARTTANVPPRRRLGLERLDDPVRASSRPATPGRPALDEREVATHACSFASPGGAVLCGTWFTAVDADPTAVVVVAGAGMPAHAYRHLARHLAACGAAVLTFDYRGVGASRTGDLRRLVARTEEWSADLGAALHVARRLFPGVELHAVAHSVGTFLLGAAPGASALGRVVLLGPHTAYWGDYGPRWRPVMRLAWHVLMPRLTRLLGYLPARASGLGADLPRGIALDWAARRHPDVMHSPATQARFRHLVARFAQMRARTLAITASDDVFATAAAGARLLRHYPHAAAVHEEVAPDDLGVARIGHFGFLRRDAGPYFWERAARWLQLCADEEHAVTRRRLG
jgi:predicted alpha/beta hydrolase